MNSDNYSITIVDLESGNAPLVGRTLSEAGHTVSMTEPAGMKTFIGSSEQDLLIICVKRDFHKSRLFLEAIHVLTPLQKARTIIFGPLSEAEPYLVCLEAGIFLFLHTPCGKKFLIDHIARIITLIREYRNDEMMAFTFSYRGAHHTITLPGEGILRFLISTMENSLDQNRLLIGILKNKSLIVQNICDEPVMEEQDIADNQEKALEKDMYRALEAKEFKLYYQPVISLDTDCLAGFESLIRWEHPEKGLIPPDSFIPTAEKSPFIIPLGFWILEEAIRQLAYWHENIHTDPKIRVNINLSARQFLHAGLSDFIVEAATQYGVQTQYLGLEITESAFMDDMKSANLTLLTLKSLNFPLYLDDFGTGYSSLTYLLHFPVDILKIDKSFVEWMHIDEQSCQIVKSVISLAHNMNKLVVAEGIESDDHYRLIKEFGCDYGQGYYFGKPLKADDAALFIKKYCK